MIAISKPLSKTKTTGQPSEWKALVDVVDEAELDRERNKAKEKDVPGEPKQPSGFPGNTFKGLNLKSAYFHILQKNDLSDLLQKVLPKNGILCGLLCFDGFFSKQTESKAASKK